MESFCIGGDMFYVHVIRMGQHDFAYVSPAQSCHQVVEMRKQRFGMTSASSYQERTALMVSV